MPFTVPWRFCCGGCRLVLGLGAAAGGCCAWSAPAAAGVAAIKAAKLRRVREGFLFTADLTSLGLGSLTGCHLGGRGQADSAQERLRPGATSGESASDRDFDFARGYSQWHAEFCPDSQAFADCIGDVPLSHGLC